ncbi:RabGAP/TBC domain-containing protein [Cavenderia fasciculata]|uniref:RabGAP/TBC domain-containing protein n=1 Tax=Cavenderia fasciculata TaxID=261658 RepID=F4Q0W8_CACFS|nr:RabGAP/TBC domain-containing protein [Cavenderia fasciculata]EGG18469.1 RabGAP/TBC domain-containing protein [Cavenderia fasciculata]|eukprot:XP_004366373.1 RabGAP/TBC domain-containing protein [Cavenderia fasciculata]
MWINPKPQYSVSPLWVVVLENRFFSILRAKSTDGTLLGKIANLAVHASDSHPLTYRIIYKTKNPQVIAVSESLDLIKAHWVVLENDILPRLDEHDWDIRDQYVISKIIGMATSSEEEEADQNDEKSLVEFKFQFSQMEEKLLTYFRCSLYRDGLTTGKAFITQQSVCYYSANPVQHIILPFARITSINKESTLGLLPNTIKITACIGPDEKTEKKFLFYFLMRDQAYDLLEQLWKLCMDEIYQSLEVDEYSMSSPSPLSASTSTGESSPVLKATKQRLDIEKKNRNFQRFFKLPENEDLLSVHVCWIVRKNTLIGDLYLSANFFCIKYKESFTTKKYTTVIPISKIASIKKTRPFLGFSVFTDTIQIVTVQGREINIRLIHCEEALQTMRRYWQQAPSSPVPLVIPPSSPNHSPVLRPQALQIESIGVGWFSQEPGLKHEKPEELKYKLEKWESYFGKHGSDTSMSITRSLRHLIHIGVPDPYRGHIWAFCSGAGYMWEREKGYYDGLLRDNAGRTSLAVEEIEKDVRRTFAHHPYFKHEGGVDALRRVLTAYSWRNPTIGYCQSMNVVAGIMLLYMQEEAAFWVLCRVCEVFLPDYYVSAMIGSIIDQKIFAQLVENHLPDVYKHLEKVGLPVTILSLPWFMCMFVSYIPFPVATRVVDCFLFEGTTVLFQTGLAILKINKQKILEERDSEVIVEMLRNKTYDIDELIQVTFQDFDIPEDQINELRNAHKFKEIKRKETIQINNAKKEEEQQKANNNNNNNNSDSPANLN